MKDYQTENTSYKHTFFCISPTCDEYLLLDESEHSLFKCDSFLGQNKQKELNCYQMVFHILL